jgi:hypothetical protein
MSKKSPHCAKPVCGVLSSRQNAAKVSDKIGMPLPPAPLESDIPLFSRHLYALYCIAQRSLGGNHNLSPDNPITMTPSHLLHKEGSPAELYHLAAARTERRGAPTPAASSGSGFRVTVDVVGHFD